MRVLKALAVASMLAVAPAAMAQSQTVDLTGVWQGAFWSGDGQATLFQITFDDGEPGGNFTASVVEPNTFGNETSRFLQATVQGTVSDGRLSMLENYDGVGGVAHAVAYNGVVLSERRIVGIWNVQGGSGQFEIVR
jgi:hypothetical protein